MTAPLPATMLEEELSLIVSYFDRLYEAALSPKEAEPAGLSETVVHDKIATALFDKISAKLDAGFAKRVAARVLEAVKGDPHFKGAAGVQRKPQADKSSIRSTPPPAIDKLDVENAVKKSMHTGPSKRKLELFCGEWAEAAMTSSSKAEGEVFNFVDDAVASAVKIETDAVDLKGLAKTAALKATLDIAKAGHAETFETVDRQMHIGQRLDATFNEDSVLQTYHEWVKALGDSITANLDVSDDDDDYYAESMEPPVRRLKIPDHLRRLKPVTESKLAEARPGVTLKIARKSGTDEWVVQWIENGKVDDEKSYYTDDKKDAMDTMREMQARINKGGVVESDGRSRPAHVPADATAWDETGWWTRGDIVPLGEERRLKIPEAARRLKSPLTEAAELKPELAQASAHISAELPNATIKVLGSDRFSVVIGKSHFQVSMRPNGVYALKTFPPSGIGTGASSAAAKTPSKLVTMMKLTAHNRGGVSESTVTYESERKLKIPECARRLKPFTEAAGQNKLSPKEKKALQGVVQKALPTNKYFDSVSSPLHEIGAAFEKLGFELDAEGIYTGKDGSSRIEIRRTGPGSDGQKAWIADIENAVLAWQWHKMESGRYEITGYVS